MIGTDCGRCSVPTTYGARFSLRRSAPRAPHRSRFDTTPYRDAGTDASPPPHPTKRVNGTRRSCRAVARLGLARSWRGGAALAGPGRAVPCRAAPGPRLRPPPPPPPPPSPPARPPPAEPCAPRRCSGCCFGLRCFGLRRLRCAAAATAFIGTGATPGSAAHRDRTEPSRVSLCARRAARTRNGSGTGKSGCRRAPCGRRSVPGRPETAAV